MKTLLPLAFIVFTATLTFAQSPATQPRLRPIQQNGKWGYIDNTGKVMIRPQFDGVEEFSEGLAAFENEDGKHGYIDETGKIVIAAKFDSFTSFSEGLAAVSQDLKWGYIDKSGRWTIPNEFIGGRPFSDGLALVGVPLNGKATFPPGPVKQAFIDKNGKIVLDVEHDILNGTFTAGAGTVQYITKSDIKEVLIDKTGKIVVQVEEIETFGFSEGLVAAKESGKWGYLDTTGRFVIQPQFEAAHAFSEGMAAVYTGKKWGYIDRSGRLVIPARYNVGPDKHNNFSEGLALVYLNDKCLYIDKTGKTITSLACSEAERFDGGIALVRTGEERLEKRGYINKQGKYIWGPTAFKHRSLEEISARAEKQEKEEEVLTPLTAEEKALNPKEIILNQPDFAADLNYFVGEGFGGHGAGYRLVRKGNRYRHESEFWIFIGEVGKPSARLFPRVKQYDDFEQSRAATADDIPIDPQALALENDVTFTFLGAKTIDGHHCLKIEAVRKSEADTKYFFYAARDLKNLVIVAQVVMPKRAGLQRLGNISFDVPDSLVQIPSDYKPIEHDRWTKIETAKVTYKGSVVKDASVFRAPGGQLFLRVNDWTYLIRPKEATVETAFQGLLVTRSGEFVWTTNENEAYSATHYRSPQPPSKWETKEDRHVTVKPNSVTFRSTNYDRDQAMIEIRW